MTDRESADEQSSEMKAAEPLRANAPSSPIIVSVCTTCKTSDGGATVGPEMLAAVQNAFDDGNADIMVRPVQCLSVCKRPATVAVTSPDGYTFLFGDLQTESGTAALVSFVASYRKSDYGLVPWRERAEVLRKGTVARIPPARWSPSDGLAPK
jgi:predicted metal-binding protein